MKVYYETKIFSLSTVFLSCIIFCTSCKKFLTVSPPINQLESNGVFSSDATATAAITGIYSEMMNTPQFTNVYTTAYAGMSADELYYYTPGSNDEFLNDQITQINHSNLSNYFWLPCYKYIYSANACIEGLSNSNSLSPSVKSTLIGEAKFIRAFCYFELVNLFGDVPLVTTPNYIPSANQARDTDTTVYRQIINDLKDAENRLSAAYTGTEKTRPNKWAVAAMLARVYLYNKDWANAQLQSDMIINSNQYSLVKDINTIFIKNSAEAIWQLQPVNPSFNTYEGYSFLPATNADIPKYLVTANLLKSFEAGDLRKSAWIASRIYAGQTLYYPYKYKVYGNNAPVTEYYMVFRLAEQFLIRAEAKANQNNVTGASDDLNIVRVRAGLTSTSANNTTSLLQEILHERQVELLAEWGHRWFDLKRTGQVDKILSNQKSTWKITAALWPIPNDQINLNPSLIQNPGY